VSDFGSIARRLQGLLDTAPQAAVVEARRLDLDVELVERVNRMSLRAAILIDGGAATRDNTAVAEGVDLLRQLHSQFPKPGVAYNLANGLVALAGHPPRDVTWPDNMERTHPLRFEARRLFASVALDGGADSALRTQAWTNLANQLSLSWRLGEAHDARLAALRLDPSNGVAAGSAVRELLWLDALGLCAPTTQLEIGQLARVARDNGARIAEFAGADAARQLQALAASLDEPRRRSLHADPFIAWVEKERLTLAPTVELVEPSRGHIDWLMLPSILEREPGGPATPPPVYAMFNALKADFVLARDLAWKAMSAEWPPTASFADTLDYARYGPASSALVLAHRSALDLLDKVAVLANHYFELGMTPRGVHFRTLWRLKKKDPDGTRPLRSEVEAVVRAGNMALMGLVELADDYDIGGWLQPQRDLRNAGTHRFVVLHDEGGQRQARQTDEVERYSIDRFAREVTQGLRVARSAIQNLAYAIRQQEVLLRQQHQGPIGTLVVPDHGWVRGVE